jgi:predicted TIM-barrel fold metal-dependent hydrolase
MIDTHTHAWDNHCKLIKNPRYKPSKAFPINSLLKEMEAAEVGQAVLIQPSFLGSDNSYLLNQLCLNPKKLKGVVVVEPDIPYEKFAKWVTTGVTGVRLNIIDTDIDGEQIIIKYQHIISMLQKLGCHLELHARDNHWFKLLPELLKCNINLVIDHFGRLKNHDCDELKLITKSIETGQVWIKLSGWYRFDASPKILAQHFLDASKERLVWGSDYPWTQNEEGQSYLNCLKQLHHWVDEKYLENILINNPRRLFQF